MKKYFPFLLFLLFLNSSLFSIEIHEAKYNLGKKLFDKQIYSEAIPEFADIVTNYPYSPYYSKAVFYAAKSYFALGQYDNALEYYRLQANSSKTLAEKRQAAFGTAECYYRMKKWQESAKAYMNYAAANHDSPVYPASLYYAGRSLEELAMNQEASDVYKTLITECAQNNYSAEAGKRLALLNKAVDVPKAADQTTVKTSASSSSQGELNIVELKDGGPATKQGVVVTNVIQMTNQSAGVYSTNCVTNSPADEALRKQEELDRYKALVELKARLLEIKEKALKNKTEYISNLKE